MPTSSSRLRIRVPLVALLWLGLLSWAFGGAPWLEPASVWAAERVEVVETPTVSIHFFDIGQGDASLILTRDGKRVLVDTGPPSARAGLLARLRALNVDHLDALVITHAHADHLGNAGAIIEAIPTKSVLDAGLDHPSSVYAELLESIERRGLKYVQPRRGLSIKLGQHATLEVLSPEDPLLRGTRSDPNANSIVFRAVLGGVTVLFTGDAEHETELRLLSHASTSLDADVLKVAHHGSRYATHDAFVSAVTPSVAIISCSDHNVYGHPAPETLQRLERARADVFVTADVGEIAFATDGVRYAVGPAPVANLAALGLDGLVDLNSADERLLRKLPGIGKAKAKAIVAFRAQPGGFATADALAHVPGITPRTYARVRAFVTAKPMSAPLLAVGGLTEPSPNARDGQGAHAHGAHVIPAGAYIAASSPALASSAPGAAPLGTCVDINTADESALVELPGIGPAKARAIIAYRNANGAFTSPEQLIDVRGIGQKTLDALRPLVCTASSSPPVPTPVAQAAPSAPPEPHLPASTAPTAQGQCTGIDLNAAGEAELETLPGIGPAKARAIVAHRAEHGPFAHPDELVSVRGIGAKSLAILRPLVCVGGRASAPPSQVAPSPEPQAQQAPKVTASSSPQATDPSTPCAGVDINRATESELEALPGIGPAKARAIVAYREAAGPFRAADDLVNVRGLGMRTVETLKPLVCVQSDVPPSPHPNLP